MLLSTAAARPEQTWEAVGRASRLEPWSDSPPRRCTAFRRLDGLVEEERLSDVLYLGDCALEIECLGQDDLEDLGLVSRGVWSMDGWELYLLHVDAVTCAAEDEAGFHGSRKPLGLCGD